VRRSACPVSDLRKAVEWYRRVGPLEHVPGAVDYFDFRDPDGNIFSVYSEMEA
jgi:hypothetical protein